MQEKLSPAMQRRRKRAKSARKAIASETKLAAWMPVEHTTDRILSQVRCRAACIRLQTYVAACNSSTVLGVHPLPVPVC